MKKIIKLTESNLRGYIKKALNESVEQFSTMSEVSAKLADLRDLATQIKGLAEKYNLEDLKDDITDVCTIAQSQYDHFTTNSPVAEVTKRVLGMLKEDGEGGAIGGGATSCSPAGGDSVGQYTVPFGTIQRKGFYSPTTKRSGDFKNGSMSMQSEEDETSDEVNKKRNK